VPFNIQDQVSLQLPFPETWVSIGNSDNNSSLKFLSSCSSTEDAELLKINSQMPPFQISYEKDVYLSKTDYL
jgi:hypothetical protein